MPAATVAMDRMPPWLRQELPDQTVASTSRQLDSLGVDTVCRQALCPNLNSCFKAGELAFMILGDVCTRRCRFCNVKQSGPAAADLSEGAGRIAQGAIAMGLHYVVLTSVTRDDLPDGGSGYFVRTINALRAVDERIKIEILIPDFQGRLESLRDITDASPEVIGHNLETVRRLYRFVKPDSDYDVSLRVLRSIKRMQPRMLTKSSLLLGLGETKPEVSAALQDLKSSGCDIVVMGQYLAPSRHHYPVERFLRPAEFTEYGCLAQELGFSAVLSGPLARSSYQAHQLYLAADKKKEPCYV